MEICFSRGPSHSGRGCREAAGEGKRSTLIRPFWPPCPKGRKTEIYAHKRFITHAGDILNAEENNQGCGSSFSRTTAPNARFTPHRLVHSASYRDFISS